MIELAERGYSQSKIGAALGISQATVSRMMATTKKDSQKVKNESDG